MAHTKQDSAVRQASKLLDVTYIIPMEAEEARRNTDSIRSNLVNACELLWEMHEREGWKALGYTSWRAWTQVELDLSQSRGYQLLAYVQVRHNVQKVEKKLSTMVENPPQINERQARELKQLPAKAQGEVWVEAVQSAPNHQPSAKQVASVAEYRFPVTRPAPKPTSSSKRSSSGRMDTRTRCKGLLDQASDSLVEEVYLLLSERLEVHA